MGKRAESPPEGSVTGAHGRGAGGAGSPQPRRACACAPWRAGVCGPRGGARAELHRRRARRGTAVRRCRRAGRGALQSRRPGGGAAARYGAAERARILAELRRVPDRAAAGPATWPLSTVPRALRRAPDGLRGVSRDTIWSVLRGAGRQWPRRRRWCATGVVVRRRKAGPVVVVDPATAPPPSCGRTPLGCGLAAASPYGRKTRRGRSRPCPTPGSVGRRRAYRRTSPTRSSATGPRSC